MRIVRVGEIDDRTLMPHASAPMSHFFAGLSHMKVLSIHSWAARCKFAHDFLHVNALGKAIFEKVERLAIWLTA